MTTLSQEKPIAIKKASAKENTLKLRKTFDTYDKDKDGMLNRKEIASYALGEHKLKLTDAMLNTICSNFVEEGSKGVPFEKIVMLKIAIGLAREEVADQKRAQLQKEKEEALL